jgi:lipopolysaccharide export system protein LptA
MIFNYKPFIRCILFGCLAVGLVAGVGLAANAATGDHAAGDDAAAERTIHVTAERLVSDSNNNQAEFIGNVHATQGNTQITADRLKLFFSKKADTDETASAQSLEKLVASGNVQIKFDNRLAVAKQAVYITAERVLVLTGPDATVTSGENTISGEKITFYRTDGRFTVEGGSGGQVKATILPDKSSGLE